MIMMMMMMMMMMMKMMMVMTRIIILQLTNDQYSPWYKAENPVLTFELSDENVIYM